MPRRTIGQMKKRILRKNGVGKEDFSGESAISAQVADLSSLPALDQHLRKQRNLLGGKYPADVQEFVDKIDAQFIKCVEARTPRIRNMFIKVIDKNNERMKRETGWAVVLYQDGDGLQHRYVSLDLIHREPEQVPSEPAANAAIVPAFAQMRLSEATAQAEAKEPLAAVEQ